MIIIYGFNTFNTEKVVLTAEELGIHYQYKKVDLLTGEHKTSEYLKIHPLGKTPALIHDGYAIIESAAICRYFANINRQRLYSEKPLQAARIDGMMDFIVQSIGRYLSTVYFENVIKKMLYQQDANENAVDEAKDNLANNLPYLDQKLGESRFICSDEVTLADTIAFPYFKLKELAGIELSEYKHILRWYDVFKERPSVSATSATMGPGLID